MPPKVIVVARLETPNRFVRRVVSGGLRSVHEISVNLEKRLDLTKKRELKNPLYHIQKTIQERKKPVKRHAFGQPGPSGSGHS